MFQTDMEGNIAMSGWEDNAGQVELLSFMRVDCVAYAYRAISITENHELSVRHKTEAKKAIAKDADTEMADATRPGPSTQSMIDKAVAAAVKKLSQGNKQVSSRRTEFHPNSSNFAFLVKTDVEGWQEAERQLKGLHRQEGDSSLRPEAPSQDGTERIGRWQTETEAGRKEELRWSQEVVRFRYDVPSSFPDWLLTVSHPEAVSYIILNTPVEVLRASQFKYYVHTGPGVSIPENIMFQLSVGMNYMFHSPRNTKLIKEAYEDFVRRLRWRLFFKFQEDDETNDSEYKPEEYDPDYEVAKPIDNIDKPPPVLPQYLEHGIQLGRRFVTNTIAKIPVEEERDAFKAFTPSYHQIMSYLVTNDYVVTNTDKNLGIAVSERTWIDSKSLDLLSDRDNYIPIMEIMKNAICDKQCSDMEILAGKATNVSGSEQLAKFMRSKVTPPKNKHAVPVFYGIPKIHKEPVKMRPIVPCHSAIQNPAAKYISKKLKPLIQAAPTIIHGTKDLAIKLSKIDINRKRRCFIVTGDVVAFYPNIPLDHCIDIVCQQYEDYMCNDIAELDVSDPDQKQILLELELFTQCIITGNTNLVLQYGNQYYKQKQGLAMGVADSPDLANLYGWFFERKVSIMSHPQIAFYGRYIDDVFAIVYAESEAEAINILSNRDTGVNFDNCTIEWQASAYRQNFLDMTIYRASDGSIQHMPFRKSGNHQERIPWISHHPLDVKRGTYIGEMSRLATLSSTHSHYSDAIRGLAALYAKRGYPQELITKWTREHFTTRWEKRFNVTPKAADMDEVLVLKSEFNTAWNYFSAKELGDTIMNFWKTWLDRAEKGAFSIAYPKFSNSVGGLTDVSLSRKTLIETSNGVAPMPDVGLTDMFNRRMIVSRKRTRNLFDLTGLWKKIVLTRFDEDAQNSAIDPITMDAHNTESDSDIDMDSDSSRSDRIDPNFYIRSVRGD